ncbi:MAG: YceI family protein [Bacteroidales bacterium]|nr:YceI family protein [Bacteroidales bacterium]
MKQTVLLLAVLTATSLAFGQKYITKNGYIRFFSETPVESIEAHNRQVNSALDSETGDFVFKVLMKSFEFEKALMQEHFNENYVESDKFPNATFQGKISDIGNIGFSANGSHEVTVSGDLTIHGVMRNITEKGTLIVEDGVVTAKSVFMVKPADYDIRIPKTVINNIASEIEVTVDVKLEKTGK